MYQTETGLHDRVADITETNFLCYRQYVDDLIVTPTIPTFIAVKIMLGPPYQVIEYF